MIKAKAATLISLIIGFFLQSRTNDITFSFVAFAIAFILFW